MGSEMCIRDRMCAVLIAAASVPAISRPFVPESDNQVLARLPFTVSDPVARELRALRSQLAQEPHNLPIALRLARRYLELGQTTGDPRHTGYAQAALAPWWQLEQPPEDVLVLRALLRQRMHQFDVALADLAMVLRNNPRNAEARLARATVLQVQGAYKGARVECRALEKFTLQLVSVACSANVSAVTGRLRESYAQLRTAFDHYPNSLPEVRSWVLTSLAEMAVRADIGREAEAHFRAAFGLDRPTPTTFPPTRISSWITEGPWRCSPYCGTGPARIRCCCVTRWHCKCKTRKSCRIKWNNCATASRPAICAGIGCTCERRLDLSCICSMSQELSLIHI